jgi:hypothetical protein
MSKCPSSSSSRRRRSADMGATGVTPAQAQAYSEYLQDPTHSSSHDSDSSSDGDNGVFGIFVVVSVVLAVLAVCVKMCDDHMSGDSSSSTSQRLAPAPAPARATPQAYAMQQSTYQPMQTQQYTPPSMQAAPLATTAQRSCQLCGVQYVDPWEERPHTASGRTQYVNSSTGEMLWTRPQVHVCQQVAANRVARGGVAEKFCSNCGARGSRTNFCEGCGSRM